MILDFIWPIQSVLPSDPVGTVALPQFEGRRAHDVERRFLAHERILEGDSEGPEHEIEDGAGMTVDEVQVWGKERGWAEFEIVDLTAQSFSTGGATNLNPTRFTIYHCGGHVVSAVVG
jgi:hypothetical protein